MTLRRRILLLAAIGLGASAATAADAPPRLRVYVPRAIAVSATSLRLDTLCVVQCQDEELAKAAAAVALGRAPQAGEKIVVDRRTILSRLAASGIPAARVDFTGTEQVAVTRNEKTIDPDRLVQAAEGFLQKTRPGPKDSLYRLADTPKALVVLDVRDGLELRPRLAKDAPHPGTVKVEVAVVAPDGEEVGAREMVFQLAYPRKVMVATRDIPADGTITAENAKVQIVPSLQPSSEESAVPFGAAVASAVREGAAITPSMLKQAGPRPLAVRRNQNLVMRIQTARFTLSTVVVALQDGRAGDLIKVQNADSRRIVTAKVATDGTVSPFYEEKP